MRSIQLGSLALAIICLTACDDFTEATTSSDVVSGTDGAHWQKVCAKKYFYQFGDGSTREATYCGEWQTKCVDADGNPAQGCA